MINRRRETTTRFVRWQVALMVVLLISLTSGFAGKRKQTKEKNAAVAASRFQLGSRYLVEGDVRRALGEFSEAIRLQPRNAHYQHGLALAYFFVDQYDLA